MAVKNIYIFGIGGIGGFIGSRIVDGTAQRPDLKTYFIARGAHGEALARNGLTLDSCTGKFVSKPAGVVSDPRDIPKPDLCILCVKSYDLTAACHTLKSVMHERTVIIPVLNGVDIYERMRTVIDNGYILPGCVYMNAFVKEPGVIKHLSGDLILYGRDPKYKSFDCGSMVEMLHSIPNIRIQFHDDSYPMIWEKYMFVAGYALVTSYSRQTIRQVYDSSELKILVRDIISEIRHIAVKKGYSFPEEIVDKLTDRGGIMPPEATTSYQRDIARKNDRNEGDIFGGTILRMAKEYLVPTPVTAEIARKIGSLYQH